MSIRFPESLLLFFPLFRKFPHLIQLQFKKLCNVFRRHALLQLLSDEFTQRIMPAILTRTFHLAIIISYRFLHRFLKMTPKISQRRVENNKDFIKTVVANKLTEVVKSYAQCVDIFLQSLQNINIHGNLFRITHTRFPHRRGLLWTARSLII